MSKIKGRVFRTAIEYAYQTLYKNKESINALNVFPVPDGDTGTNMTLTMRSAINKLEESESDRACEIAKTISEGSLMGARGNSGVILSQILRGFAKGIENEESLGVLEISSGFEHASEIAYNAVMKPTEGTILTVIRRMAAYASDHKNDANMSLTEFMVGIISEGNLALEDTPNLLPILKEAGVVDAGGKGLMVIVEGAFRYFSEDKEELNILDFKYETENFDAQVRLKQEETGEIEFGYCTEFLIHTEDKNPSLDEFKNKLSPLGDCLLVVGGDSLIKVHVHTNTPGTVLNYAVELGHLEDIKIDNMRLQNEKILKKAKEKEKATAEKVPKKFSYIAVSAGDGIRDLYLDLGVDFIIEGGQTMNPSTEDFLKAIDQVSGEDVFLLPNNSNIILAAEQAKAISKRSVHVIPSKSIPEGMVALLSIQSEESAEKNLEIVLEALTTVKTGMVTFAVRDTEIGGLSIEKGNYIGVEKGIIHSTGKDLDDVTLQMVDKLCDDSSSLITLFYGNGLSEEDVKEMPKMLEEKYPECDVELIRGGQPLYYYIVSVE